MDGYIKSQKRILTTKYEKVSQQRERQYFENEIRKLKELYRKEREGSRNCTTRTMYLSEDSKLVYV